MKNLILVLSLVFVSFGAFASQRELSAGDTSDVVGYLQQKMNQGKLSFNAAQNVTDAEVETAVVNFLNKVSTQLSCVVDTDPEPMIFSCGFKDSGFTFGFITTGKVQLDNGQIVGVYLDDVEVVVQITK